MKEERNAKKNIRTAAEIESRATRPAVDITVKQSHQKSKSSDLPPQWRVRAGPRHSIWRHLCLQPIRRDWPSMLPRARGPSVSLRSASSCSDAQIPPPRAMPRRQTSVPQKTRAHRRTCRRMSCPGSSRASKTRHRASSPWKWWTSSSIGFSPPWFSAHNHVVPQIRQRC